MANDVIQVIASDGGSPSRFDATTLVIFLLDTNDETPEFVQGMHNSVDVHAGLIN